MLLLIKSFLIIDGLTKLLCEKLIDLEHHVLGIDNMIGGYEDNVPNKTEFYKIDCCDQKKIDEISNSIPIP